MAAQPYKMLNSSERAMLIARFREGVHAWAQEHLAGGEPVACVLLSSEEAAVELAGEREWISGSRAPGSDVIAVGLPCDWPRDLARVVLTGRSALHLDPAGLALMRAAGTRLIDAFAHAVLAACLPGRPGRQQEESLSWTRIGTPTADVRTGSGYGLVRCQWRDSPSILVLLSPGAVLECLGPWPLSKAAPGALEQRSRAMRSESVVLDAIAGEAEVAVEDVTTLAVGDVLKLDRAISEPLQVRMRGGGAVCSARLGALQGRAALQLI